MVCDNNNPLILLTCVHKMCIYYIKTCPKFSAIEMLVNVNQAMMKCGILNSMPILVWS